MAENYILQRTHVRPLLGFVLIFTLLVCGGLLVVSIIWIYHKIHDGIGMEIAEVAVALLSILVLALIWSGICVGLWLDRFVRHRNAEAYTIYQAWRLARFFFLLLGYEVDIQDPEEILTLFEKPKRRGRSPTHPLDRWTRVVVAWENRDRVRNPMNLTEFLCEEFGQHADGSPQVSENCFYENRKKVIAELRRRAAEKDLAAS
jgi:hypothetical protein